MLIDQLAPPAIGWMLQPGMGNLPHGGRRWAADNGRFANPDAYRDEHYFAWLQRRAYAQETCVFATAPDVVGDPEATWALSAPVLPLIRALGYPAALVGQDGLEHLSIDWDAFDALFIGGSTEWKLSESAYGLVAEAKVRGKWCHMGRVNSLRRLRAAQVGGYDSADGTYLTFGPNTNLPKLQRWLQIIQRQPSLWRAE